MDTNKHGLEKILSADFTDWRRLFLRIFSAKVCVICGRFFIRVHLCPSVVKIKSALLCCRRSSFLRAENEP